MKQKLYTLVIATGLLMFSHMGYSQSDSSNEKIDGYFDHIVVTVPGIHFDSLMQVLKSNLPNSVAIMPENDKAFLLPENTIPYVELWNSSMAPNTGSQISLGSKDENAIAKAQSYYGFEGTAYGEMFTVGAEYSSGHPYGGNFFVSYGSMNLSNPSNSIEVKQLNEIYTLLPNIRTSVKDDYAFFGITVEGDDDGSFIATDAKGTVLNTKLVESTPAAVLGGGIGHVSLYFELNEPVYEERTELTISDEIKLVFDEKSFTLILLNSHYE
jgi:hypothetical protein